MHTSGYLHKKLNEFSGESGAELDAATLARYHRLIGNDDPFRILHRTVLRFVEEHGELVDEGRYRQGLVRFDRYWDASLEVDHVRHIVEGDKAPVEMRLFADWQLLPEYDDVIEIYEITPTSVAETHDDPTELLPPEAFKLFIDLQRAIDHERTIRGQQDSNGLQT